MQSTTTAKVSSKANIVNKASEDHWIIVEPVMEHLCHIILFNVLIIKNFNTLDHIITLDIIRIVIHTAFTTCLVVDSVLHCITVVIHLATVEIAVMRGRHWRETVNYGLNMVKVAMIAVLALFCRNINHSKSSLYSFTNPSSVTKM